MKELKQRFAIWYNHTHGTFGTLWAERFRSLLVENSALARETVAAYIDLNAVRAGICSDPGEYRFCGYAEAIAGSRKAQTGLVGSTDRNCWAKAVAHYRVRMFGVGSLPGKSGKPVIESTLVSRIINKLA